MYRKKSVVKVTQCIAYYERLPLEWNPYEKLPLKWNPQLHPQQTKTSLEEIAEWSEVMSSSSEKSDADLAESENCTDKILKVKLVS